MVHSHLQRLLFYWWFHINTLLTGSTSLPGGAAAVVSIVFLRWKFSGSNAPCWNAHHVGMDCISSTEGINEKCKLRYFTAAGHDPIRLYFDVLSISLSRYLSRKMYDYTSCINKSKRTRLIMWWNLWEAFIHIFKSKLKRQLQLFALSSSVRIISHSLRDKSRQML